MTNVIVLRGGEFVASQLSVWIFHFCSNGADALSAVPITFVIPVFHLGYPLGP
ncbi:MAG TPA: hypothetical protein VGR59_09890 [Gemmatimonadaceae bacterium]|nr:hypothetical protein [Gemmatimonadaceae bacterium]